MQTQYFKTSRELLEFLKLPLSIASHDAEAQFKTRVPIGFAKRIVPGDPNDPLLLQILASPKELDVVAGFKRDPLKEEAYNPVPGVIHKYGSRALLTVTGSCAINCRYCFRRHFAYEDNNPGRAGWHKAFDYIKKDPQIKEVIFSGGDPLQAPDSTLEYLINGLSAIEHIKTIRIHSRIPVVLPERITADFCKVLANNRFRMVMVLHANHPNELSREVKAACDLMRASGVQLLNQSVLLKNINHNAKTLVALSEKLWAYGVLPYYLHLLDKVAGAAHFDVSADAAKAMVREMSDELPGYLVPRLVQDLPGEQGKQLVY